jgi:hypothetical protein
VSSSETPWFPRIHRDRGLIIQGEDLGVTLPDDLGSSGAVPSADETATARSAGASSRTLSAK